jgi:hypothetical protein
LLEGAAWTVVRFEFWLPLIENTEKIWRGKEKQKAKKVWLLLKFFTMK